MTLSKQLTFIPLLVGALTYGALTGCKYLQADSPRASKLACQAAALEPLVGEVLDAEDPVRDLYAGRANLQAVLANLDATAAEMVVLQNALAACEPPPALPALPDGGLS